jgi:hypothetical protein
MPLYAGRNDPRSDAENTGRDCPSILPAGKGRGTASCDVRPDILERNRPVRWQGRSHRPEMGTRIHGDFHLSNHAAVLRLVCYAPARACALPPAELSIRYSLKKGGLSVCVSCGLLWLLCREVSNDRQHSRMLMPENVAGKRNPQPQARGSLYEA